MNLAEQLKKYRLEHGLTQKQLAAQLFISDKTISKWEKGHGYPDVAILPQIAAILQTTVDDLLNERTVPQYHEYRSEKKIGGRPLVHIILPKFQRAVIFPRRNFLFNKAIPQANGIVAIGIRAKGIISIGVLAQGIIALGFLSWRVLAIGVASAGFLAIGDVSIGIMALGNISFGVFTVANIAIGVFASGNIAVGWTALGNKSYGSNSFSLGNNYTSIMYSNAVKTLHEKIQHPLIDYFYQGNVWVNENLPANLFLAVGLILLLTLAAGLIFLKRRKLFSEKN